ncbi:MAG: type II toxin-antitoxin system RelE/ParE family toxin [Bacteroidales bacterium]|nr:type II toxin-antitoxin system RelE/ParE family toxin [Bacteroidales bacterium]
MNNYKVFISEQAKSDLTVIVSYLKINWSSKVVNDFLLKYRDFLNDLKQNPYIYNASEKEKQIRRCVLTIHNSVFYRLLKKQKKYR